MAALAKSSRRSVAGTDFREQAKSSGYSGRTIECCTDSLRLKQLGRYREFGAKKLKELVCIEAHQVVCFFQLSNAVRQTVTEVSRRGFGTDSARSRAFFGFVPVESVENFIDAGEAGDEQAFQRL
jgi:hypothetical protein